MFVLNDTVYLILQQFSLFDLSPLKKMYAMSCLYCV